MDEKLGRWAELLLDTGKRNNLINFKDTNLGTLELVEPDFESLYQHICSGGKFEVYNPEAQKEWEELDESSGAEIKEELLTRSEYIQLYASKLKKAQVLGYNKTNKPIKALGNISKKARTAIEETGVNIAHLAFGFINWIESEDSSYVMRAPILLAPVTVSRESIADSYYIKVTGDDIVLNPTFAFKVHNDYGITLPEFEEDNEIDEYLAEIEEMLCKLKWSITKECKLGIFSFQKINMYKDIVNNSNKIIKNPNIMALTGDMTDEFDREQGELVPTDQLIYLNNVVDADSSQAEAIALAKSGRSFVLQGPPGTGKSQTITNIIAEYLADGKRVLFVSEKLAALNVVYDKLKKAGLAEFCLELHSHKSNKKQVVSELNQTLRLPKSGLSNKALREVQDKKDAQELLDRYVTQLHEIQPNINQSLYALIQKVSEQKDCDDIDFLIDEVHSKGEEFIANAEKLLSRYEESAKLIGCDYHNNDWYGYINQDISLHAMVQLKNDLKAVQSMCANVGKISRRLNKDYSFNITNIKQAHIIRDVLELFVQSKYIVPAMCSKAKAFVVLEKMQQLKDLAQKVQQAEAEIGKFYDNDIYNLDGVKLEKKLERQFNGFFSRLFNKEYKSIVSEIKLCRNDNKRINYKSAVEIMHLLKSCQLNLSEFTRLVTELESCEIDYITGTTFDFDVAINELGLLCRLLDRNPSLDEIAQMPKVDFVECKGRFESAMRELNNELVPHNDEFERLVKSFDSDIFYLPELEFIKLEGKMKLCLRNIDKLDNWVLFIKLLDELDELGVRSFVDFAISAGVERERVTDTYIKAFYSHWVDYVMTQNPFLMEFTRIQHDQVVQKFCEKDELNLLINTAKIKNIVSSNRPDADIVAKGSSISVLLREGEKKRKLKGVRKIIEEIGELVQTLKPCFLMSPLSVSTFLNADTKFDVVIFDEASQIFPQDAVGAIYRGKQVIVVGDSKQMPPSNFFNSTLESDEDIEDDVADFESILDMCSTCFEQRRLRWHYRSRNEQLIAFSNKNFYDNSLITFPTVLDETNGAGVEYVNVDGVFDRKSRTNRIEAERIVDLIFEHAGTYPERSLGVVAFSISQQNLIDNLVLRRLRDNPEVEGFFSADRAEPFFVKNLETVQGDERDTIIFSVAYAKDSAGKLLLNFGPLNREGGERRLNVAVTRAKINVKLVSSMRYTDIDLKRTKAEGSRLLREYLDFAENGDIGLTRTLSVGKYEEFDSPFESEVCDFLRANGVAVDTQVGCSSFKIDLAVKRENSSQYVLAIECDGASYHSSKTARDRDRLRQSVLENMGWKFYRIWSTDWFRNKRAEKDRLLLAVRSAFNDEALEAVEVIDKKEDFSEELTHKVFEFPVYKLVNEKSVCKQLNWSVEGVVRYIVQHESPVSEEWLLKRIAFMYDREKVTSIVRQNYMSVKRRYSVLGIKESGGFLYYEKVQACMLRVMPDGYPPRDITAIAVDELALGMKEVIKLNVSCDKLGLFKTLASQLGFSRLGDALTRQLELALIYLGDEIEMNGDMISIRH